MLYNLLTLNNIPISEIENYTVLLNYIVRSLFEFYSKNNIILFSTTKNNFNILNNKFDDIILQCINSIFIHKISKFYIYLDNNIYLVEKKQKNTIAKSALIKSITFNFYSLGYNSYKFNKFCRLLVETNNNSNLSQTISRFTDLLSLSKKIPFNIYDYYPNLITDDYRQYRTLLLQEQLIKLIQYILNKINNGIKKLIGTDDIKIIENFDLKEVIQKKNSLLNQNKGT